MAWTSWEPSAKLARVPRKTPCSFLTIVILCAEERDEDVGIRSGILLVPSLYGHGKRG